MATEYNRPNHRYYQKRYHVKLAVQDICKQFIYASGIKRIDNEVIREPLFSLAEPGVWYDPSDLTTLFQDTAGTQPVTTAGQTVALVLDKSRGLVLGSELITNGDFSNGITGWTDNSTAPATFTAPSGAGLLTANGTARARARTTFTTVVGRTYRILFQASASVDYSIGTSPAAGDIAAGASSNLSILFVATTTTTHLQISTIANGVTSFDNVSVRELAGNHATQSILASRPTYGVVPATGRRNLAIGSGDVGNNAVWPNTATQNGITATKVGSGFDTDGLPYVDIRYQGTATGTFHDTVFIGAGARTPASPGQDFTASAILRVIGGSTANTTGLTVRVQEETAPTTFIDNSPASRVTATVDTLSISTNNIATGNQARVLLDLNLTSGQPVDITYRIKALQLELGSTRTTYQRVVSAFDVTEAGVQSLSYLSFDGIDDFLQTAAIDFAGAESLGTERITNGTFGVNTTGWTPSTATLSVVSGAMRVLSTVSGVSARLAQQSISGLTVGQRYKVTCQAVTSGGSGSKTARLEIRSSGGTTSIAIGNTVANPVTPTNLELTFTATETTQNVWLRWDGDASTDTTSYVDFDNVSFKEVLVPADNVQVFVGLRKLSDAARGVVLELGTGAPQSFRLEAPQGPATNDVVFASRGSAIPASPAIASGLASPVSVVVSGQAKISTDALSIRANRVSGASGSGDQGTGNFANAPVYIGRRAGTSLPFNGNLFGMIVRVGSNLPDGTIGSTETWLNTKTRAY